MFLTTPCFSSKKQCQLKAGYQNLTTSSRVYPGDLGYPGYRGDPCYPARSARSGLSRQSAGYPCARSGLSRRSRLAIRAIPAIPGDPGSIIPGDPGDPSYPRYPGYPGDRNAWYIIMIDAQSFSLGGSRSLLKSVLSEKYCQKTIRGPFYHLPCEGLLG